MVSARLSKLQRRFSLDAGLTGFFITPKFFPGTNFPASPIDLGGVAERLFRGDDEAEEDIIIAVATVVVVVVFVDVVVVVVTAAAAVAAAAEEL